MDLPHHIELLDNENCKAWDAFVDQTRGASIYHLSSWVTLIKNQFGHQSYHLLHRDKSGNVDGVLPLVRLRSRLFGDYMVSMPYFNYGGVVAGSIEIKDALYVAAISVADQVGVSHLELRQTEESEKIQHCRTDKVVMLLDLPADPDDLWSDIGSKRRSQIKRPLRENVEVLHGQIDLLDQFYAVFSRNMRDLGTPVYPKSFFRAILESFTESSYITIVQHQNKPVAAAFLLGWKSGIEIPWASSLREANPLGVNMLLYWEVIKRSIELGYKVFDFGRSTMNAGTYRFKKQWGSQPKQLYWYYWLKEGESMPELTPSSPKYKLAIATWKKLPVPVANLLGPYLVKNLP